MQTEADITPMFAVFCPAWIWHDQCSMLDLARSPKPLTLNPKLKPVAAAIHKHGVGPSGGDRAGRTAGAAAETATRVLETLAGGGGVAQAHGRAEGSETGAIEAALDLNPTT